MHLKDYQVEALEAFSNFWRILREKKAAWDAKEARSREQGEESDPKGNYYLDQVWTAYGDKHGLPKMLTRHGTRIVPTWATRRDRLENPIPHVCIKVPTGGGKTLLGAAVIDRMQPRNGLVLWVVPSRAIFRQTKKLLATRESVYRQFLDRACGGRVKLVDKDEDISLNMLRHHLCVMPLMLQASARETNDFLRLFRDSGRYPGVFPEPGDLSGNDALLKERPDLDRHGLDDEDGAPGMIKHSLCNLLKIVRPIVVLDEAHNAYSKKRSESLSQFSPRFVLELSATPQLFASNVLVDIPGRDLQREEMIKLPLRIAGHSGADWKFTLLRAVKKRDALEEEAKKLRGEDGRYIRPIMIVRVERTGKDQRDGEHIHVEDARQCLMQDMGIRSDQIRVKSAEKDEVGSDDLLSPTCEVRYIITKSALQEGWDCPFAYVLAILDSTRTELAVTQMTGRILRQPDAMRTGVPALDSCYIYCFNKAVEAVAAKVRDGLQAGGMGDLVDFVVSEGDAAEASGRKTIHRRKEFRDRSIFLPRVLRRLEGGGHRLLEYERDIHYLLDWPAIAEENLPLSVIGGKNVVRERVQVVDLVEAPRGFSRIIEDPEQELGLEFFVRWMGDVCPNAWVAARVVERAFAAWEANGLSKAGIFERRTHLAESLKQDFAARVEKRAEEVFRASLKRGDIAFSLVADENDYRLPLEWEEIVPKDAGWVCVTKSLGEKAYESAFNGLEKDFAVYVDNQKAVKWWHRLAARGDYDGLQGWLRHRAYPDFVVSVERGTKRVLMLETKGMHLIGNADTTYKEQLFKALEEMEPFAAECGEMELHGKEGTHRMALRILAGKDYERRFQEILAEAP